MVGKITGCHGIKGWVKMHSYTDPPKTLLHWVTGSCQAQDGVSKAVEFDAGKAQGKGLIAHIKGVDDRTVGGGVPGAGDR